MFIKYSYRAEFYQKKQVAKINVLLISKLNILFISLVKKTT